MGLKSDQAIVLRRRVLGGMVRNLVLFSAAFLVICVLFQRFAVPPLADEVADSTSTWHILDSTDELQALLDDAGLSDAGVFDALANNFATDGLPDGAGSISVVESELNTVSEAVRLFAAGEMTAEDAEASLGVEQSGSENDKLIRADSAYDEGVIVDVSGAEVPLPDSAQDERSAATSFDKSPSSADVSAGDEFGEPSRTPVAFVDYKEILAAEGISPERASAAEGWAAVQFSAAIQELQLSLDVPQGAPGIDRVAVLAHAAAQGIDGEGFAQLFEDWYRQSQSEAFEKWENRTPLEQSQAFGESNPDPVWQVEMPNGTYHMRDIATYTLVKSFKIPLAILLFVVGWLVIVFRALNRSLRYFDDLSGAVGKLLADKDAPIQLPPDLSIARNELAVIRSQSLADERAAHAAEQRKNELVAYLAHDIRTPLTSVLGYLDLLRETTDLPRDTLRRYADVAYSKAERLESLINEFFEITRYNLSAIPIERETVGVRLFCQQVAEAFFPEASARHIDITVDVNPGEQFFVDPDKMARALGNVLRNAVAYADEGSTIALVAHQNESMTVITVANKGREISEAHLETIFEKFYREDGARSSKSGGAGLGLAIAREIVVAHSGEISAASQEGVTVFTLSVPTTAEAARARAVGAAASEDTFAGRARPAGEARGTAGALPAASARGRFGREKARAGEKALDRAPRSKPRNARHGRGARAATVRDNEPTERIQPQRRHL